MSKSKNPKAKGNSPRYGQGKEKRETNSSGRQNQAYTSSDNALGSYKNQGYETGQVFYTGSDRNGKPKRSTEKKEFTAESTSTKNGRLGTVKYVENPDGSVTPVYGGANTAKTFTYSDPENRAQSGRVNIASRRERDYDTRVGLNNDQRSPEAIQRLRDLGLTDEEIGVNGSGGSAWRGLATG